MVNEEEQVQEAPRTADKTAQAVEENVKTEVREAAPEVYETIEINKLIEDVYPKELQSLAHLAETNPEEFQKCLEALKKELEEQLRKVTEQEEQTARLEEFLEQLKRCEDPETRLAEIAKLKGPESEVTKILLKGQADKAYSPFIIEGMENEGGKRQKLTAEQVREIRARRQPETSEKEGVSPAGQDSTPAKAERPGPAEPLPERYVPPKLEFVELETVKIDPNAADTSSVEVIEGDASNPETEIVKPEKSERRQVYDDYMQALEQGNFHRAYKAAGEYVAKFDDDTAKGMQKWLENVREQKSVEIDVYDIKNGNEPVTREKIAERVARELGFSDYEMEQYAKAVRAKDKWAPFFSVPQGKVKDPVTGKERDSTEQALQNLLSRTSDTGKVLIGELKSGAIQQAKAWLKENRKLDFVELTDGERVALDAYNLPANFAAGLLTTTGDAVQGLGVLPRALMNLGPEQTGSVVLDTLRDYLEERSKVLDSAGEFLRETGEGLPMMGAYTDEDLNSAMRAISLFYARSLGSAAPYVLGGEALAAAKVGGKGVVVFNEALGAAANAGQIYDAARTIQAAEIAKTEFGNRNYSQKELADRIEEIKDGKNVSKETSDQIEKRAQIASIVAAGIGVVQGKFQAKMASGVNTLSQNVRDGSVNALVGDVANKAILYGATGVKQDGPSLEGVIAGGLVGGTLHGINEVRGKTSGADSEVQSVAPTEIRRPAAPVADQTQPVNNGDQGRTTQELSAVTTGQLTGGRTQEFSEPGRTEALPEPTSTSALETGPTTPLPETSSSTAAKDAQAADGLKSDSDGQGADADPRFRTRSYADDTASHPFDELIFKHPDRQRLVSEASENFDAEFAKRNAGATNRLDNGTLTKQTDAEAETTESGVRSPAAPLDPSKLSDDAKALLPEPENSSREADERPAKAKETSFIPPGDTDFLAPGGTTALTDQVDSSRDLDSAEIRNDAEEGGLQPPPDLVAAAKQMYELAGDEQAYRAAQRAMDSVQNVLGLQNPDDIYVAAKQMLEAGGEIVQRANEARIQEETNPRPVQEKTDDSSTAAAESKSPAGRLDVRKLSDEARSMVDQLERTTGESSPAQIQERLDKINEIRKQIGEGKIITEVENLPGGVEAIIKVRAVMELPNGDKIPVALRAPYGAHSNVPLGRQRVEAIAGDLNAIIGFENGIPLTAPATFTEGGRTYEGYAQQLIGQRLDHGLPMLVKNKYGSFTQENLAKLVKEDPDFRNQLETVLVERMVLGASDAHDANFLVTPDGKVMNIDLGSTFVDEVEPSLESFQGTFMPGIKESFSEQPISAQVKQKLEDFVTAYDTAAGKEKLKELGLRPGEIEALLSRARHLVTEGKFPRALSRAEFVRKALEGTLD